MRIDSFSKAFVFMLFVGVACIPLCGCGRDMTPAGPEKGSLQQYLDENPDVAARVDEEAPGDEEEADGSEEPAKSGE